MLARARRRRCRGSTARAAGRADPTARARRGTRTCAPSRGLAPRRGGRRRTRRRTGARRSRRAASRSAAGCGTPAGSSIARPASIESCTEATISRSPSSRDAAVAELDHLREVVAGVDVHDREREARGPERLLGQSQQDDRILAAGEQQTGRSNSAATSRRTKTASASSSCRFESCMPLTLAGPVPLTTATRGHRRETSDCSVARAPCSCSERSASRYAATNRSSLARSPKRSRFAMNASGSSRWRAGDRGQRVV